MTSLINVHSRRFALPCAPQPSTLAPGACRYHQVHGIADESGRSLAVNYWQESIFGWSLADDKDHAARETAIRTQLPVRDDTFAPAPWEGFLD